MSGIIDYNSKEWIALRNAMLKRLIDSGAFGPLAPKTCISCGSKTQPCCGH